MTNAADVCIMTHYVDPDRPRLALDGLYLCYGHHAELERLVAELPRRHDDLQRALLTAGGPKIYTGGTPGLTVDEAAARLRSRLAGILASWCSVVVQHRGVTPPASTAIAHTAPWMLRHIKWCAAHDWVTVMLTELRQATREAIGITDIPARRIPLDEQCRQHLDGARCTGIVTLLARGDDWLARCDTCAVDQDAIPYLRAVRSGHWITCEEVIALADVYGIPCSPDVVRQWKHRRRIRGRDDGRRAWYDLRSVQTYLDRRRAYRDRLAS